MASKNKTYHPLIAAFIEKLHWWDTLEKIKKKLDTDVYNIFKLHEDLHKTPRENIEQLAEKFKKAIPLFNNFLKKKCDPDLQFLSLLYWFEDCMKVGTFIDADFVKNHLEKILNKNTPDELQSIFYGHTGVYYRKKGNASKGNEYLLKCVQCLKPDNPRFIPVLINYGNITSYFGTYPKIKNDIELYLKDTDKDFKHWGDLLLFFYSIEMGHLKQAWDALKNVPENAPGVLFYYHKFKIHSFAIALNKMIQNWNITDFSKVEKQEIDEFIRDRYNPGSFDRGYNIKIEILDNIYSGNSDEVIKLTQEDKLRNRDHWESSWFYCSQIRIELMAGNIESAEILLKNLISIGYEFIWNDWFMTRIELAKKNIDAAKYYFQKLLKSVQKHNAEDRFNFEVKIAHEIKATDLILLSDNKNLKIKKPSKTKINLDIDRMPAIIGISKQVIKLKESISKVAPHDINVLILGETGTGKEVVAKSLHNLGPRKKEPYIAINCAAISETLLESELFGHQKGAFTGATEYHKGVFEQAGKGTVFLDEIGEISSNIQSALLRVLETKDIKPIGSSKSLKINCRIIAATNANLELKVKNNEFRMDLLHRLNRVVVHTNPLRKKIEDIPHLSQYFLNQNPNFTKEANLTFEAIEALKKYPWPGNARELKNEMENLRIFNYETSLYDLQDLDPKFHGRAESTEKAEALSLSSLQSSENKHAKPTEIIDREQILATEVLSNNKIFFRRIEKIKKLFDIHNILTRAELIKIMGVSHLTVTKDLKLLIEQDYIKKVMPSKSPRSHYFEKLP
ncbi:MAG: sigma 54-interacting transcriptional regulator [Pseudomonadales bacterium]|nr:sigma 54-interacting transcriptional regulator [Pseudomonadales bacterium]PCJ62258.1 MAG: hypothetical protein COA79_04135 [Planctomycetota bacterium]